MEQDTGPITGEPNADDSDAGGGAKAPADGIALCLSGGGYRAMIFHIGALIRLNDAGLLSKLNRVSSVSGGSITAGVLGLHWKQLQFDANGVAQDLNLVVQKLRKLASNTIDADSVLGGIFTGDTIGERIAEAYDEHVFGGKTLQDLPDEGKVKDGKGPRFVINATNVQTGSLFRFAKPYMADYRIGKYPTPSVKLSQAVAASSAFPPILSPVEIKLDPKHWQDTQGATLKREPFTSRLVLSDGGVYDNLGLETAWKSYKTVFVSDGGGKLAPEEKPAGDWARHAVRIMNVIDNQVRAQRYRHLIDSYKAKADHPNYRTGAYWGIRTNIADYKLANALPAPHDKSMALAATPTRLKAMDSGLQDRLINWGYAVCDAALRSYYDKTLPAPGGYFYPGGIG